jgi:hypothetical protein
MDGASARRLRKQGDRYCPYLRSLYPSGSAQSGGLTYGRPMTPWRTSVVPVRVDRTSRKIRPRRWSGDVRTVSSRDGTNPVASQPGGCHRWHKRPAPIHPPRRTRPARYVSTFRLKRRPRLLCIVEVLWDLSPQRLPLLRPLEEARRRQDDQPLKAVRLPV